MRISISDTIGVAGLLGLFLCIACGRDTASAPTTTMTTTSPAPESPPPVVSEEPQPSPVPEPEAPRAPSRAGRVKPVQSFAVYTLSRGTGVPAEARQALEQVTNVVESDRKRGVRVTVETTRLGLEGEQRMCVEYQNSRDGARAWERASAIVKGVDLVNLVAEPCASPATHTETQKEEEKP